MWIKRLSISVFMVIAIGFLVSSCESEGEEKIETAPVQKELSKVEFDVTGMTCEGCVSTIDQTLKAVNGVESADVSLEDEHATVIFDASKTSVEDLKKAVEKVGYGVEIAKN